MSNTAPLKTYLAFLAQQPKGFVYQEHKTRKELLGELETTYKNCTRCPLAASGRKQVVFGAGSPHAQLMFVGEGPGRDEDAQGKPFVGRAGKLLMKIIQAMNLSRSDIWISNTVKCRPPKNRTPLPHESATCSDLLLFQEISIIQPRIICTLGAVATAALLGKDTRLSRARGRPHDVGTAVIIPTYHPAYLLRNPEAKKLVWADMKVVLAKLN